MALAPGTDFAGFTIERTLGIGGMGTVYLARHPRLPRSDALKLLRPELSYDPDFAVRFAREADIVARLSHPNIVGVNDRGTENGQLWISMPFVDGMDAEQALKECQGPMPAERAVRIIGEIASALDFAHGHGMWHRDVKPANIMLATSHNDEPERVMLTDFGIAKAAADEGLGLTKTGNVVASFDYAPPEQIEGRPVDHRVDVYALGCVLYKLVTGSVPYPGVSMAAALHGHMSMPPPRPTAKAPWLTPAFDDVIARAMAKDPAARFGTCRALAAAAQAAIRPVQASPAQRTVIEPRRQPQPMAMPRPMPMPMPRPMPMPMPMQHAPSGVPRTGRAQAPTFGHPPLRPAPARHRGGLLAALAAALLVVGAGTAAYFLNKEDGRSYATTGTESLADDFSGPSMRITPNSASADSTSEPSVDDQGNPTSFNASNLIDGLVDTAWRATGDASGQEIRFFFSSPVHLTSVGLIPGYDKTDPLSGVDRFPQNRRVAVVEWTTPGDETVTQEFSDDRSPQFIDVDVVTSMVTILIVSTLSPGDPDRDYTPISEVFFEGQQD